MMGGQKQALSRRRFVALALAAASSMAAGSLLGSCAPARSTKATDLADAYAAGSADVFEFTDSAGRRVVLPRDIRRISPSGSYAQIMLGSLCPERLVSLSSFFSNTQAHYLGEQLLGLPVLGRFYGSRNGDMNYEELIRTDPDVIIDIGEAKTGIAEDMDGLQEQTGLPVIFVEATLTHMDRAYEVLGTALGVGGRTEELYEYVREVLDFAHTHRTEVASLGIRLLYCSGADGLDVVAKGSVHSGAIDLLGVDNVAELSDTASTLVSAEQVMLWAPDTVLLSPAEGFYLDIYRDKSWAPVPAVANGRVFEVPGEPYEWLNKPPSVQTVLGIQWLGNLLAPAIYDFDIVECVQRFYKLFWHYDLSAASARELMANSTFLDGRGR